MSKHSNGIYDLDLERKHYFTGFRLFTAARHRAQPSRTEFKRVTDIALGRLEMPDPTDHTTPTP